MNKYYYVVYLDGELITQSGCEYDSYEEAKSEGGFAINTYSDILDRIWSDFDLIVEEC